MVIYSSIPLLKRISRNCETSSARRVPLRTNTPFGPIRDPGTRTRQVHPRVSRVQFPEKGCAVPSQGATSLPTNLIAELIQH